MNKTFEFALMTNGHCYTTKTESSTLLMLCIYTVATITLTMEW